METDRVAPLNEAPVNCKGRYVLYWMQQSQRVHFNPALEHAISRANELALPVVTVFGLHAGYPEANERHFAFMLEGLAEVADDLHERGIQLVVRMVRPDDACLALARSAALIVCDRGYLRHQKRWRETVAREARCQVVRVEGDVVVPVDRVSDKREYAARTVRPKIARLIESYIGGVTVRRPVKSSVRLRLRSDVDASDPDGVLARLDIDRSIGRVQRFRGGGTWRRNMSGLDVPPLHERDGNWRPSRPVSRQGCVRTGLV